jgi:hypothetical protein
VRCSRLQTSSQSIESRCSRGCVCLQGMWQHLGTFLVVTTGGEVGAVPSLSGWGLKMQLGRPSAQLHPQWPGPKQWLAGRLVPSFWGAGCSGWW